MMIEALVVCTVALANGQMTGPVFYEKDSAGVAARMNSEIIAHPEKYPPGKCTLQTKNVPDPVPYDPVAEKAKRDKKDATKAKLKNVDTESIKNLDDAKALLSDLVELLKD